MMRIKIFKWYIDWIMTPVAYAEHKCLNQIMEGTYSCEYCYPLCKKCGRDTADWGVNCNSVDGCDFDARKRISDSCGGESID